MHLLKRYFRSAIILSTISFLSLYSFSNSPSGGFVFFKNEDKVIHLIMYLTLSATLLFENNTRVNLLKFWWIIAFSFSMGALMEVLQAVLTAHRSADIWDVLFNTIGIVAGYTVFQKLKNKRWVYRVLLIKSPNYKI